MLKKLFILTSPLPLAAFLWLTFSMCSASIDGYAIGLAPLAALWFIIVILSFELSLFGIGFIVTARLRSESIFIFVLATILSSSPLMIYLGVGLIQLFVPFKLC